MTPLMLTCIRNIAKIVIAVTLTSALTGCGRVGEWVAVRLFYREAVLTRAKVFKDLGYWASPFADQRKHRLDFYVPEGTAWPVLIFVYGGGWRGGDKALKFGDADPYGNIGRFYAARGIGVAVVNYRLQPAVTWRDQVKDVARSLAWVYGHADDYGADTRSIFVSGHSSGAQLAARAALDQELLRELRVPAGVPCGVIAVSGAPFDISDSETYARGTNPALYERNFRAGDSGDRWKYEASAINLVTPSAPPFLLLHGRWEAKGLKRQNQVMYEALKAAGVPSQLVVTPWEEHFLIVAALSHPERLASTAVLDFIRTTECAEKFIGRERFG
jgi:acetyl esterase/lipase